MTTEPLISPARHAFSPVLYDESVIDTDGPSTGVFYTPAAKRVAEQMDLIVAGAAGATLLTAWCLSIAGGPAPLQHLFTLLAFAIAGVPALSDVWDKLSRFRIDVDVLMLLGAGLAAFIGSPFEGALLLFLFALSGAMESFALRRTQSAITSLRELSPKEATVVEDGVMRRVALRQVAVDSIVLIKPGEKIPLDGVVIVGSSSVDESAITGESIPRDCAPGDDVFAGTLSLDGRLEIRVSRLAADTTLAKIVELVTKARQHPAKAQRLIDRIGPTYSIIVMSAAALVSVAGTMLFDLPANEAIRRGIAVLIVASPCALIIATPVAYLSAIAAAAKRGVLVKGGAFLEIVARATTVSFDKTGTLTTGKVRLTDIVTDGRLSEEEMLRFAGALSASSSHPLARAVNDAAVDREVVPPLVTDYRVIPGKGESGIVDGRSVWVGRPDLLAEHAPRADATLVVEKIDGLRQKGRTVSAIAVDENAGLLAFEDTIRDGSRACVDALRRQGIRKIDMLSGDHEIIAKQVASKLGLDQYRAALSPEGKLDALNSSRSADGSVVLVGDGINDAPALAHADAGIAMGSMGTDVALEAADIVLMNDHIEGVAWLHRHARRTASIVRQNLTLAIAVISILSVFAAMGSIPLPLAVIGHEGSTVLVAVNALRLLRSSNT